MRLSSLAVSVVLCLAAGCGGNKSKDNPSKPEPQPGPSPSATAEQAQPKPPAAEAAPSAAAPSATPDALPNGLLLAYAQFETEGGKVLPKPGPARLEILTRKGGKWEVQVLQDPDSNVFHKVMAYELPGAGKGLLSLGGMEAAVKHWRPKDGKLTATTLWTEKFGGKWNRMRDAEVADVYGDGKPTIVVATHDQGVVAALKPDSKGGVDVVKLGAKPNTFVHEIEIGDIDGDQVLEVYATPSEPNKLDGGEQHGEVWRFIPKTGKGPEIAADLGNRHAKEIYVGDVDGDGADELYVAVEALTTGKGASLRLKEPVEIRRYDKDTPADAGQVVATLPDRLCRFLTVGDVDGDGKKEMIAAAYRSGLWLLRPPATEGGKWSVDNIDRESSGFEHSSVLADLDADGKDELYVAADEQGELRRYVWQDGKHTRETIHSRELPGQMLTWNIMPVPTALLGP